MTGRNQGSQGDSGFLIPGEGRGSCRDSVSAEPLMCLMSQVLGEHALSSPIPGTMEKGPPQCPAMEGAHKHKFLPSVPSLNTAPFAYGTLKSFPSGKVFPPNEREMQTT